jgi:hypothetical protein
MFMNECIDSTIGRIHVCSAVLLDVTIRGLVGPFTLSEVAHKNRENHFARRTQGSEARIQHTLTWKAIQDTHNTDDTR